MTVDTNNHLYFCTQRSSCYSYDANGNMLWNFTIQDHWTPLHTSPLLYSDEIMYIFDHSTNSLYALADPNEISMPLLNSKMD